nr:hypothetical protein CFP56_03210 [Quercus suber]
MYPERDFLCNRPEFRHGDTTVARLEFADVVKRNVSTLIRAADSKVVHQTHERFLFLFMILYLLSWPEWVLCTACTAARPTKSLAQASFEFLGLHVSMSAFRLTLVSCVGRQRHRYAIMRDRAHSLVHDQTDCATRIPYCNIALIGNHTDLSLTSTTRSTTIDMTAIPTHYSTFSRYI